ncbi:MAG TPA: efflux RND transporter periplasmic adaptor subunit [Edaphocola sp.]|nr:efflux RND transporter periplasmic adaptor subunit [Edaphocola sp.]
MTKYIPLLALSLLLASCGNKQKSQTTGAAQALPFPVIEVPAQDIVGQTAYPVSIEGIVNSEVRAKISGYITDVLVDEGDYVRKGQPLFRLETHALSEDARAAKANVEAAQVGVDQLKPLVAQNIISNIQLETAKAKLAQAKASYQSILANIGYASINSPIDGYVGSIPYRKGSLVDPGSPQPLTTVSNTKEVYVYFAMNEIDYLNFLQNMPGKTLSDKLAHFPKVKLKMANGEIYAQDGHIQTVTAQIDPSTGTVNFRAEFPNPDHLIANGSSGTILIPKMYKNAVLVPETSTYEQQGKTYVYLLGQDSSVTATVITYKDNVDNIYVVTSGVKAGDKIIGAGADKLKDSQKIVPQMTPFDSVANNFKTVFQ